MSRKKNKFKEWDKMLESNLDLWLDNFCSMVRKRENWDTTFQDFLELSMFKLEFKDMIEEAIAEYKKDTNETDVDYEGFAYSLLQQSKEDVESLMNTQEGIA